MGHRRAMLLAAFVALTHLAGAQATIVGTVFDSLRTVAPLRRATVVIPELSRYVASDEQGRFQMDSVPAGHYSITFLHPILDSLDISAESFPITVPASGTITARLATPSPAALVWLICRSAADTFPALMIGHVRNADDSSAVAGATVTVSWSELMLGAEAVDQRTVRAVATTGSTGAYVLCGVPMSMRVRITATVDDRTTAALGHSFGGRLVEHRDFLIGRGAAVTVSGVVRDEKGMPASGAIVIVADTLMTAVTDSVGRFAFHDVPSGTQVFEVKHAGAWPRSELVNVPAAGLGALTLTLGPGTLLPSPTLSLSVAEIGDRTGFEDRRRAGFGHFIVPDEHEKKPASSLRELLLRSSLLFAAGKYGLRLLKMRGAADSFCVPNYFVNGYPWRSGISGLAQTEIERTLDLSGIRGIEVYTHVVVPRDFDRKNGCGSVVLWTK